MSWHETHKSLEGLREKPLSPGTPGERGWGEGVEGQDCSGFSPLTPDPGARGAPPSTGERGACCAARQRLAEQQAALVEALVGPGAAPPGFDGDLLRVSAQALATKRRNEVAHVWPRLTRTLDDRFADLFSEYAGQVPLPQVGGPRADGRAFARFLARRGLLPDEGKLEALRVDLHFRVTREGLMRRRGPVVRVAYFAETYRIVIAFRLPWIGAHWFVIGSCLGRPATE